MNDDETTTEETAEAADAVDEAPAAVEDEPTPISSKKPHVERVGSNGTTGAALVFECSVGDFHARGAEGEAAVKAHIADEHGAAPKAPAAAKPKTTSPRARRR